ncbi:MAG: hypothetical protein ABI168_12120 [Ginsengibacter sp.]
MSGAIRVPPVRIEIVTAVKGLSFDETYSQSQLYNEDGLQIRFIHLNHLLRAKKQQADSETLMI